MYIAIIPSLILAPYSTIQWQSPVRALLEGRWLSHAEHVIHKIRVALKVDLPLDN